MSSRPRGRGRGGFRGSYRGRGGGGDWGSSSRGRGRGSYEKFDSYRGGRSDDNYRGRRGSDGYRGRGSDGYRGRGSDGYRGRGSDGYRGRGSDNYRGRSESYRGRSENYHGRSERYERSPDRYEGRSESYRSKRGSSRHYDDSPPRRREGSYRRSSPNPEKLIAALGPDAEDALTAIISKVMKKSSNRDDRGRDDREGSHRYKEGKERRESFYREHSRERRDHRDDSEDDYHRGPTSRSYPSKYSGGSAPPPKRRTSMHGEQPYKRQRVDKDDEYGGSPRRHESFNREDSPSKERKGSQSPDRRLSPERDLERGSGDEGHDRGGRFPPRKMVELKCPHCPGQRSITFKEYKYHLTSEGHKHMLGKVARKHSLVLRKIRVQQREEQKDIEAKWRDETPEEFKSAVTRFCSTCKLAFKCMGVHDEERSEGIALHNRSKLHRMQRHYLHPRCGLCRMTFQSRMLYEYHISSITHMRERSMSDDKHGEGERPDEKRDEEDDDINLDNFMTVDSVGDDEELVGSEHDEITGGMETNEAADKAAHDEEDEGADEREKRGDDSNHRRQDEEEYWDKRSRYDTNGRSGRHRRGRDADFDFDEEEEEDEEAPLEVDWSEKQQYQEEEEDNHEIEPRGTKYVRQIDAYFCGLCYKIIRADRSSSGSRAVERHCRSKQHIDHYYELHPQQDKGKNNIHDGANGDENKDFIKKEKVEIKKEVDNETIKTEDDNHDDYDKHEEHYEDEEEHYDEEYENEGGVIEEEMEAGEEESAAAEAEYHEDEEVGDHEEEEEEEHEQEEQAQEMEEDDSVWEHVDNELKQGSDGEVAEGDGNKVDKDDAKENKESKEQEETKGEGEPELMSSPEKKDEEWFEVGDDVNIE